MRCARIAVGCLALALLTGPAAAEDEFADESSQERGSFARPSDLRGKTVRMDELKGSGPAALDQELSGGTSSLGNLETGTSRSIEQTLQDNRGWQPPPCDPSPRFQAGTPTDDDLSGWAEALDKAEEDLATREQRWKRLEVGAVRVRVEDRSRQAEANRDARDQARDAYAKARCDLVDLIVTARRAGVPPGTLRPYLGRLPTDLQP